MWGFMVFTNKNKNSFYRYSVWSYKSKKCSECDKEWTASRNKCIKYDWPITDWKTANLTCNRHNSTLIQLKTIQEFDDCIRILLIKQISRIYWVLNKKNYY